MTDPIPLSGQQSTEPERGVRPEDAEAFDELMDDPKPFINFETAPPTFTIRGARLLRDRLKKIGQTIGDIRTEDDLQRALGRIAEVEILEMGDRLRERKALSGSVATEYSALEAALNGTPEEAAAELKRLQHRQRVEAHSRRADSRASDTED